MTLLTGATPKPLVTHTLTHTETHSHTLLPTHLSGGSEIELGLETNTQNNYLSLLRRVIHFPWIYSHLPLFFPSSHYPPPLLLHIFTSLVSPPSQVMLCFPRAFGQNVTIQWSYFWFIAADGCHTMSRQLAARQSNTVLVKCVRNKKNTTFFFFFLLLCSDNCSVSKWEMGKNVFLRLFWGENICAFTVDSWIVTQKKCWLKSRCRFLIKLFFRKLIVPLKTFKYYYLYLVYI